VKETTPNKDMQDGYKEIVNQENKTKWIKSNNFFGSYYQQTNLMIFQA
jgi:hypothetical protein